MDRNRRIRELEDHAWIKESPRLSGCRVDFALIMGAVGLGIVMAEDAPLHRLLLLSAAGLAWSFSGRAHLATRSWLHHLTYDRTQTASRGTADDLGMAS